MLDQISRRSLFQFEVDVPYLATWPQLDGTLKGWDESHLAPYLIEIDDEPFADVYWGWNDDGFVAAFEIYHEGSLRCDPKQWWRGDGVRLCIDTRDARDNRRGTRYCHLFYALPSGGGKNGRQPIAGLHKMSRAKESPPIADLSQIAIGCSVEKDRYVLEVGIPFQCLHGWNPAEHPRIGLFYKVRDTRYGDQHFSVDEAFGWNVDPSSWAVGVLNRP